MFLILMLTMIPLAITELGTDSWITELVEPEMEALGGNSAWVLVYTMAIMLVLRFMAGPIVHRLSPLGLLTSEPRAATSPSTLPQRSQRHLQSTSEFSAGRCERAHILPAQCR